MWYYSFFLAFLNNIYKRNTIFHLIKVDRFKQRDIRINNKKKRYIFIIMKVFKWEKENIKKGKKKLLLKVLNEKIITIKLKKGTKLHTSH